MPEEKKFVITKQQIILAVGVSLVSVFFYIGIKTVLYFQFQYENNLLQRDILEEKLSQKPKNPFKDLTLSSKAFFVVDLSEEKTLASANEEVQFPLASLTKLMTIYIAGKEAKNDTLITITEKDLEKDGDQGLFAGEIWPISKLIKFTLMTSSNDGASALASIINSKNIQEKESSEENSFLKKMNQVAQETGMVQSYFLNESGLDITEKVSGGYGSAKDIAILLEKILEEDKDLFNASIIKNKSISSLNKEYNIQNTNIIVDKLPGVLISKTGYTDLAGGNLAMAFDVGLNHQIAIVVLGSTREERFIDMEKLYWATLESLEENNI